MVDAAKFKAGVMNYANRAILPKLDGHRQFIAGMALGLASGSMDRILPTLSANPVTKALGVADGQAVDVEKMYHAAKEQFRRQPALTIDVPMIGQLTFHESDLDELYQSICGA